MCRWMGSHFHDSTDINGGNFSSIFNRVTIGRTVWDFEGKKMICLKVTKMGSIIRHEIG